MRASSGINDRNPKTWAVLGLWAVLAGTYLLGQATFAYWDYRTTPIVPRWLGLLTWQGIYLVFWGICIPLVAGALFVRWLAPLHVRRWHFRHLFTFYALLLTAGSAWFLVAAFVPIASGFWREEVLVTVAGVLLVVLLPAAGLGVTLVWMMWRRKG